MRALGHPIPDSDDSDAEDDSVSRLSSEKCFGFGSALNPYSH
jgi:hypothetical protein